MAGRVDRSLQRHDGMFIGLLTAVAVLFVPAMLDVDSNWLAPHHAAAIGALLKLAALLLGTYWATRARRGFEPANPIRWAWTGVAASLGLFAAGQAVLVYYETVLLAEAPHPMLGDVFFVVGTALLVPTLLRFARSYHGAGIVSVKSRQIYLVASLAALMFGLIAYLTVGALVRTPAPTLEKIVSGIYPVLDCVILVPAIVLVRILCPLRGGSLWGVWLRMLTGFLLFTVGDITFAYVATVGHASWGSVLEPTFAWGYTFVAWGAYRQCRLGECEPPG